jgi:hypothetical protein
MKKIIVVSDTHAGSSYGLMPPDAYSADGPRPQNDGQKYLWNCWLAATETMRELNPDYYVFLGDAIDGDQWREGGRKLQTVAATDQVHWASEVLAKMPRELPKTKDKVPLYMIHGTPYHDGKSGEHIEFLAEKCSAVPPTRGYHLAGRHSFHYMDLEIGDVILNFLHEIPGGVGFYRGTAMDREMLWSAIAGKAGKSLVADHVHRAHLHYFVHIEHASKHGVINPCWQLTSAYAMRKSAYRMQPDIGFTVIYVDETAKSRGVDPIKVEKYLYPLPSLTPMVGWRGKVM